MIDDTIPAPAIIRPAMPSGTGEASVLATALPHRVVIVDLPLASRPTATITLGAMVQSAVREVLDRGGGSSSVSDEDAREGEEASDDGVPSPADLDEAVILAHEQRIAVLHARLDAARAGGAKPRLLADMSQRLLRAEAARRLATARLKGSVDVAACSAECSAPPRQPTVLAAVLSKPRMSAHYTHRLAQFTTRTMHASIGDLSPRHRIADRTLAAGLLKARRSLAAARHSLGDISPRGTRAMPVIASLWHWEGSTRWSLSPDRPVAS